ncbi:MAG: cytochrome C oxidase subunit IV family protein [Elusimicrobia bacterium]|nr:cytochrome C oxidase subunit IV family protein [Elusimicrobiota bacterium]
MSDHDDAQSHVKLYWMIGAALFALTIATVGVSKVHLVHPWGLIVGLAIATLKAGLVAAIFMHLKWESRFIYYFLGVTLAAVIILFAIPIWDFEYLRPLFVEHADVAAQGHEAAAHPPVHGAEAPASSHP